MTSHYPASSPELPKPDVTGDEHLGPYVFTADQMNTHYLKGHEAALAAAVPQPEAEAQKAVARLNVKAADDPIWPGMNFIGLTDAGRALPAGDYKLYAAPTLQAVKVPLTRERIEPLWHKHCHAIGPIAVQDFNFAAAIQRACAEAWGATLTEGERG